MSLTVIIGIVLGRLSKEHITTGGLVIQLDCIFDLLNCSRLFSGFTANIFLNI